MSSAAIPVPRRFWQPAVQRKTLFYAEGVQGERSPDQPRRDRSRTMKNAIIVGASSGIGAVLAAVLAAEGYNLFTAMAKGDGLFWVASPQQAAAHIYRVIQKQRSHAYVTRRWRIVAWFLKFTPSWLLYRMVQTYGSKKYSVPYPQAR